MGTINIDAKLLEALQNSTCFGIAYDPSVPECKQCDVKGTCKAKMDGMNVPTPTIKEKKAEPKKETKPATKTTTKPKAETKSETKPEPKKKATPKPASKPVASGDMPDFKQMSLDELKALAGERSVEWKDYGNDQITRMRLIMALKKSY